MLETLLEQMRTANNGSQIDGFGNVIGHGQVMIVRALAKLIDEALGQAVLPMRFNVVCYFSNGIRLEHPIVLPDCHVHRETTARDNQPELICYTLDAAGNRTIKVALDRVVAIGFKHQGILIEGLRILAAAPTLAGGYYLPMLQEPNDVSSLEAQQSALANETIWRPTYVYQSLLLTSMSIPDLQSQGFFSHLLGIPDNG